MKACEQSNEHDNLRNISFLPATGISWAWRKIQDWGKRIQRDMSQNNEKDCASMTGNTVVVFLSPYFSPNCPKK